MEKEIALELRGVTKQFGDKVVNKDIDLTVYKGEILAVLGENGSGKTTLMNAIAGIYAPEKGEIYVNGEPASIKSPKDAFGYGIGMIHQHFKLVDVFTAAENIVLGNSNQKYNIKKTNAEVKAIADKYGFSIDPKKKIYEMSVSEKQTVEIIKVLYRGANILILDEPTAVLTPQETEKLFAVLRKMKEDGKSIIIITHKMHEVLSISDRVTVLLKGELVGTVETKSSSQESLTEMMVGKKVDLNIQRSEPKDSMVTLTVDNLRLNSSEGVEVLKGVSFTARKGEILGIAGIAGSGQKELLEAISGLLKTKSGRIIFHDPETNDEIDLLSKSPRQIREMGITLAFVPEDRLGMGLVGNMDIIDNVMLRSYRKPLFERAKFIPFLDRKSPKKTADRIIDELEVVTPSDRTPVRTLSGGNVQKVLVGREISLAPKVLMAAYPVRGLDINSSYLIYNLMNEQKEKGVTVIFVGEDLDVLIDLCDRIVVMAGGTVSGIVDARTTKKEEIGLLMTKVNMTEEEVK